MELVELANRYGCKIEVASGILTVDAKSIMSVMRLAATKGTVLKLTADGADANEAIDALATLIGQFDELGQDQADAD